jgi:hypothetical protein
MSAHDWRTRDLLRILGASVLLILLLQIFPQSALAFQSHPEPEGLYVHQISHVFFSLAMGIMVYWLQKNNFVASRGWRLIQVACILLIVWNVDTITGHYVEEILPDSTFFGPQGWHQRISVSLGNWALAYYVLKMDHLLSVPALVCLFLGIRILLRQAMSEERAGNG